MYAGGAEHAVGHLLYARFWTKVIHDAGLIHSDEPFQRYRNQGMVLAYTAGREVKSEERSADADENDPDEPLENWKVLKPEEHATVPQDQWVWRWVKMSKSKGNVVTPDEMAEKYGADSLRLFTLFVAPYEENVQWTDKGIEAAFRYVNRAWRVWTDLRPHYRADWREQREEGVRRLALGVKNEADASVERLALSVKNEAEESRGRETFAVTDSERQLRRKLHQTIRKVGEDIEEFRFNTAVAALMEFTNELSAFRNALGGSRPSPSQAALISEVLENFTLLMSPITPHLADELWERLGKEGSTFRQRWPQVDEEAAAEESITVVVQVNGKLRERITVAPDISREELERLALATEKVVAELNGKSPRKVITVPGKLVNIVIGQ
jgi:leucyl-tRNA synthetase